ncbi:MAG TPA: hypothetical protein VFD36_20430 [Kofleriaceae bacterium]|nr:hypothetical protein [Kofleriaceae bacterium]
MTAPVLQKTWTIGANQRIAIATYTTLVTQGGKYLKTVADYLLAHGHTCKGSCDATTGAMDGVNRWATDADAAHQAANTTTAVSWMVLTDGNGCNILLSFVGATGDIARIGFSPGGNYVVAGTSTFTPTATDESVLFSGTSLIGTSTADDRIVNVWVDSTAKLMRTCCYVAGALQNASWGVELVNPSRITLTYSPAVWGFAFATAGMQAVSSTGCMASFSANSRGGYARINGTTANVFCGAECFQANYGLFNGSTKPDLQKGIGATMWPITIASTTSTRQGPIGNLYDWQIGGCGASVGTPIANVVFPGGQWIALALPGNNGVVTWPWDGTTPPETT